MRRFKINKNLIDKMPKWVVGYGRSSFSVPYPENPREGKCDSCGRSMARGEINVTSLHHWIYAYKHATLKKDPFKVLENLSELCFPCHRCADALREILSLNQDKLWMVVRTALLMPEEMKVKLDWVCKAYLNARKTDRKKKLDDYVDNNV